MADLSELIIEESEETIYDRLNAGHDTNEVPRSSWLTAVNVGLSLTHLGAEALAELRRVVATLAASGFLDFASGLGLTLLAKSQYQLDRQPEVFTEGYWLLTSVATAPEHTITAGQLTGGTPGSNGLLYENLSGGTLSPGAKLAVKWSALDPGPDYNLTVESALELKTSLVGVTVTNPPVLVVPAQGADESGAVLYVQLQALPRVAHVVSGLGTALSVVVTPGDSPLITVNLETDGTGAAVSTAAEVAAAVLANNDAAELVWVQALGTGAGLAGPLSTTLLTTWISTQGQEEEADGTVSPPTGLKGRCVTRWSTLGIGGGNEEAMLYWAFAIPAGYEASPVTRARVYSNRYSGSIHALACTVLVAGPAGALSAAELAAVAANFEAPKKYPIGTQLAVVTTSNLSVTLTGTIFIRRSSGFTIGDIQTLVQSALTTYQQTLDIGGDGLTLYKSTVVSVIRNAQFDAIRNVSLSAPASESTSVAYNQSVVFNVAGLSYSLVD